MPVTDASEWKLHPSLLTAWLQTGFCASGQCSRARSSFHEDAGKKKTMSFLEKWLCWRLASRSSHPQSPAERSVPCLELGWSERALTQPRAAQSLSVSNAGGRRGSLPTSTSCLLQSMRATKMGEREIICGNTASCMMLASLPVSCRAVTPSSLHQLVGLPSREGAQAEHRPAS